MTPEDIAKARALCEAATKGPWKADQWFVRSANNRALADCYLSGGDVVNNAAFIAAASTFLPAALDEIERLHAQLADYKRAFHGVVTPPDLPQHVRTAER